MKKLFENWRKHTNEAAYEPGRAVADIDTGEERVEPEMLEKEAMEDLAEKFGVEVEFSTTKKGAPIAIVTFEDGEQMGYSDEEEMYQDLAQRREMNEGIENITPENVQIAADALRQVATNFAPAIIIPAIMMIYQEYKDKKKADK